MAKPVAAFALLVAISGSTAQAAPPPPLVDGAPWQAKAPNGRTVKMTFRADGSGDVRFGPITRRLTWSMKDDAFCIHGLPSGDNCMILSTSGKAMVGTSRDGKQVVFSRP